MKRALVVRGGWEGHWPEACTDVFLPYLREQSFDVDVATDLSVYSDAELLAGTDLVVQCWSMGELEPAAARTLSAAVQAGMGFAGWHGGVVDAFNALSYVHLTGGRFTFHPRGLVDHEMSVVPGKEGHPIVDGIDTVRLRTEKYWVLTDPLCDVLATVTFTPDHPGDADDGGDTTPWRSEVRIPAVWTRQWGDGRVFVSTVGHRVEDFDVPEIRTITERGMSWAARG